MESTEVKHPQKRGNFETSSIFMSSPINAILEGFYETNLTMAELKKKGDFGIGTFNDLDGELILIDGSVYQMDISGNVCMVDDDVKTPFATACFFKPSSHEVIRNRLDHEAFNRFLDVCLPSRNMMHAIRVNGFFSRMRTRSVPRTANYTPLVEATALQKESEFENVRGTLVGFFTPDFVPSINVPGYHFHFITENRKHGGHLLECDIDDGLLEIQFYSRLDLNFPITIDYLCADFDRDARKDIEKAEG